MRVKRYIAASVNEAVEKIRKELGNNAMILDTKKVKTKGFLGFFREIRYEVIAAIDDDLPSKDLPKEPPNPKNAEPTKENAQTTFTSDREGAHNPLLTTKRVTFSGQAASEPISENEEGKRRRKKQTETKRQGEVKNQEPLDNTAISENPWQEQVLKEMKEMRSLIRSWVVTQSDPSSLPELYQPYYQHLIRQDVEEEVVLHLFTNLMENSPLPSSEKEALMNVKRQLNEWMTPHIIEGIDPKTRLVQIVGPTGVGKTTTIAKLASKYILERKKRVAFITSDTYRIAAIDQLKTYANILNIPMEVVFSSQDLTQSLQRLSPYELIFMDTAGRNYRDRRYLEEMKSLITSALPTETYLVVSLSGKEKDAKELVEEFLNLGVRKIIFTKLDETSTYGMILNLAYRYPILFSYITNGQSVPDDLLLVTPDQFADLLLKGGVRHGSS